MAIIISPSQKIEDLLNPRYAQVGDEVEVTFVNGLPTLSLPYSKPTQPPYSCRALVNTSGVTDLSGAWANCAEITEFPLLEFDDCLNFEGAWEGCTSLTTFPAHAFDNCQCSNYTNAFTDCSLSRPSVNNILVSINNSGVTGGTLDINGQGNGGPTSVGIAALTQLQAKGWTVNVNRVCDQPPYNCSTDVDPYCVTNFSDTWKDCTSITSFPLLDTSSGTWFYQAWRNCTSLTSFPQIDTSKGVEFSGAWQSCTNLTSFPQLNTSSGAGFTSAWWQCSSLTSFPSLNFNSGFIFQWAWYGCTSLTTFPAGLFDNCSSTLFAQAWMNCALSQQSVDNILISIDTAGQLNGTLGISGGTSSTPSLAGWAAITSLESKGWTVSVNGTRSCSQPPFNCNTNVDPYCVTDFSNAWKNCSGLTSFPSLNVSNGTNFSYSWNGCSGLSSFPTLNTSKGTNFTATWWDCSNITSMPPIDTSSGTNFILCWQGCSSLTSFPLLDVSKGTMFAGAWRGCSGLTTFPLLDTSKGINFNLAWAFCTGLTSFPSLNFSSGAAFNNAWRACINLTSFPLLDLSKGMDFYEAWIFCSSLNTFPAGMFDACQSITFNNAWYGCSLNQQSVDNILVSINTAGKSNGTLTISGGTSSPPSSTGLAAKASLVSRGWTVTTN